MLLFHLQNYTNDYDINVRPITRSLGFSPHSAHESRILASLFRVTLKAFVRIDSASSATCLLLKTCAGDRSTPRGQRNLPYLSQKAAGG